MDSYSYVVISIYSLLLGLFVDGVLFGLYRFKVTKVQVPIQGLPQAFEGFLIAHFSDFHAGSFQRPNQVKRGLQMINDLKADVICFTGDLVNDLASEAFPFKEDLAGLRAKHGVLSILGNHDYGDYANWKNQVDKSQNLESLRVFQQSLGWKLLDNEHFAIEVDGQKLHFAGVENWGKPPFPQYGRLSEAMAGVPRDAPTILLSHDPSHWDGEVLTQYPQIKLTLSGHTHAMQFGFAFGRFRFSPVSFRYKRWWGLYTEGMQHLFVSRGFGHIGFLGRVGMWPEIVEITLTEA